MAKRPKILLCTPVRLPPEAGEDAARTATRLNPANAPSRFGLAQLKAALVAMLTAGDNMDEEEAESRAEAEVMTPQRIGALTTKYWGTGGVKLTVAFMEQTSAALRDKILSHMNAWKTAAGANVEFVYSTTDPQVRISRGGGGYWSYLGTDILHIPKNQQTMNLEAFTERSDESEFVRVVRHETGHTLGFPHEHLRRDLVAKLDADKTIRYFSRTQGWSASEVRDQVLTPIDEKSLLDPTPADALSIMCYQLPGSITTDGQPITGGVDLDEYDRSYARRIYPPAGPPIGPGDPPPAGSTRSVVFTGADGKPWMEAKLPASVRVSVDGRDATP